MMRDWRPKTRWKLRRHKLRSVHRMPRPMVREARQLDRRSSVRSTTYEAEVIRTGFIAIQPSNSRDGESGYRGFNRRKS